MLLLNMIRGSSMELGLRNPMYRCMTDVLRDWKESGVRKALVLRGERQVGKTSIVRRFGRENYDYFAEFNFYESKADREVFSKGGDTSDIITAILLSRRGFRAEAGKSLLFLDEIQDCPEALTAVKFLVEEGSMDIILSGSMLGYGIKAPRSYPVGSLTFRDMHPMTFEEFLYAQGISPSVPDMIRDHIRKKEPFDGAVLDGLQSLFREYMVVGGMPECELYYKLDTKDMERVFRAQADIITAYKEDIMSYAPDDIKIQVSREFDLIPVQLGRENKKVKFNEIEGKMNTGLREYTGTIGWITESRFVNPCYNLNAIENPLSEHIVDKSVKLYANDTGLLMNMMGRESVMAILDGDIKVNEGAIAENIVCQMLKSCGLDTYYFEINKDGEPRMEIDFVTMLGSEITAIEVKSGKKRRSASISGLKGSKYGVNVRRYIKFYNGNITNDDPDFEHYPMFCAGFADALIPDSEIRMPERKGLGIR